VYAEIKAFAAGDKANYLGRISNENYTQNNPNGTAFLAALTASLSRSATADAAESVVGSHLAVLFTDHGMLADLPRAPHVPGPYVMPANASLVHVMVSIEANEILK